VTFSFDAQNILPLNRTKSSAEICDRNSRVPIVLVTVIDERPDHNFVPKLYLVVLVLAILPRGQIKATDRSV
jgi:hypothetical protein